MPVLLSEEEAPAGIFEKVAKDPSLNSDSTASDHESQKNEHDPGNPAQKDLQSKGPAIPSNGEGKQSKRLLARTK